MLLEFDGKTPHIGNNVFIAPTAVLIGDVEIGDNSSIWFNAVIRADFGPIRIGASCSIQDNVTIHAFGNLPTLIADRVTVGHNAVLEGCQIGEETVIGMQAAILPHARVGRRVMIAAGSVLTEGFETPDGVLVAGVPATVKKELGGASLDWIGRAARDYCALQARYRAQGIGQPAENND